MQLSEGRDAYELEELASVLDSLETDGRYRVEQTLKDVEYGTTQVVYRTDSNGAGPFVRKTFAVDSGCGQAYESMYNAQVKGVRFAHQPVIYECSRENGHITVVMEYVQGETLSQLVQREGGSETLAIQMGALLCDALAELHEKVSPAIIHRDVKPSNIIVCNGDLVLVDLGIAREVRPDARRDTVRFGTPGYAPPEQFGYGQTSVRSDVYAAGMVMAFCLTGQPNNEALREGGFVDVPMSPALRSVLVKATEFDPKMRYASVREMGECLRQVGVLADVSVGVPAHDAVQAGSAVGVAENVEPAVGAAENVEPAIGVAENANPSANKTAYANSPVDAIAYAEAPVGGVAFAQPSANGTTYAEPYAGRTPYVQPSFDSGAQPTRVRQDTKRGGSNSALARWLGRFWNAFVAIAWVLITAISVSVTIRPSDVVAGYALWFRAVSYLLVIVLPAALLAYLLMYKRDIRAHVPFLANRSWKSEIPFCLLVGIASITVAVVIGLVSGQI